MHPWPSVSLWAPVVAGVIAMVLGTAYWITRARIVSEETMPPGARGAPALVYGFVSRVWVAYWLAVIIGFAHARGFGPGAVAGALVYLAFPFTMLVAQALFGVVPWKGVRAGAPEALLGFTVMGGIVGSFGP